MASTAAPAPAAAASAAQPAFRKVSLAEAYHVEEPAPESVNAALLHPLARCSHAWPNAVVTTGSGPQVVEATDAESSRHLQVREWLGTQACWAARLISSLVQGQAAPEENKLRPAVLNSCTALAFTNVSRGGLAVSYASGYGFVIKKLSQDSYGNSKWGNPLFFSVSQGGLGLTAGYQHNQSVIAVLAAGSLDAFKNGTTSLGSDLGLFSTDGALTGLTAGVAMGGSQHMGMTVDNERSAFCYSKVDGVYLELSAHTSSVTPDRESNAALYGEQYEADVVLNNGDSYKHDMMPLYSMINHLGKVAVRGDEHVAP